MVSATAYSITRRSTYAPAAARWCAASVVGREDLAHARAGLQRALDDRDLVARVGVVDHELEHEAVDLRLGQRVGALGLDRVLRRHDQEGLRDAMALVADRDLALLHDLQQRRLHLRGRAVDLVREQEVAEHGAELGVEPAGVRAVDPGADQIGRHQVGSELEALERAAEDVGDRLDGQRLGQARHALQQHVAAGQQRDDHSLEHRLLADDDPLDLEQRGLERVVGFAGRRDPAGLLLALEGPQAPLLGCHVRVSFAQGPRGHGLALRRVVGSGSERDREGLAVPVALHNHLHGIAGLASEHRLTEIRGVADAAAVEGDDQVAGAQAGLLGGLAGDLADERAVARRGCSEEETPSHARSILPSALSCGTTDLTVSIGTAKPTPELLPPPLVAICELTPITRPSASSSGPPELPGLIAASVCSTPEMVKPLGDSMSRLSAEMMPLVTVPWRPNGLPMAIAGWPGSTLLGIGQRERLDAALDLARVDVEQREVGGGIGADDLGVDRVAVLGEAHGDLARALHDVVVGDDRAVAADHEAGAGGLALGGGGGDVDHAWGDLLVDLRHVGGGARRVEVAAGVVDVVEVGVELAVASRRSKVPVATSTTATTATATPPRKRKRRFERREEDMAASQQRPAKPT